MFEVVFDGTRKGLALKRLQPGQIEERKYIQIAQTSTNRYPIYVSQETIALYKAARESSMFWIKLFLLLGLACMLLVLTAILVRLLGRRKRRSQKYTDFITNGINEVFWKNSLANTKNITEMSLHFF
ncbi:MAG: uncharacterized protein A8A55_2456 [Amphiamblys sp. WSBS2006]|nr:MAG: uncharacterized protein A8A55_2456 [Amphiamblys sp. WSBS2006]